ncbi:hypothetical protein MRB53_010257 [Persea americana]|uniref:Uncharacterized protein n=1 Tax=Persea americana TaxID=3435 RepID=A0ACC2LRP2_PERAE|nr:hypothetical protein MRB53_010257 [Persea americana]
MRLLGLRLRLLGTCIGREPFRLLNAFAFVHEDQGGIAFRGSRGGKVTCCLSASRMAGSGGVTYSESGSNSSPGTGERRAARTTAPPGGVEPYPCDRGAAADQGTGGAAKASYLAARPQRYVVRLAAAEDREREMSDQMDRLLHHADDRPIPHPGGFLSDR